MEGRAVAAGARVGSEEGRSWKSCTLGVAAAAGASSAGFPAGVAAALPAALSSVALAEEEPLTRTPSTGAGKDASGDGVAAEAMAAAGRLSRPERPVKRPRKNDPTSPARRTTKRATACLDVMEIW
jgi:hypothetical protein